ncbi:MAG: Peptidase family [Bacteroidota bacterium]|jgi:murein DD-endopeptidase MepM/ murein hydrolase activator NlpD
MNPHKTLIFIKPRSSSVKIKRWFYPLIITVSALNLPAQANPNCPFNSSVAETTNVGTFTSYGYANPLDNFATVKQNYAIGNSGYPNHLGVDYMVGESSNVYAICDGVITSDSQDFTYQRTVRKKTLYDSYWDARIILKCNTDNNMLAIYGHVDKQTVSNGSKVKKGKQIAVIAPAYNKSSNRNVALDHLHFGIRVGYTNPFYNGVGFGIATKNVTLIQAEQNGFQDPLNYLCNNPNPLTYFDGAGSLISPTQAKTGGNNDVAIMQAHASIGLPSTVVFQFKKDAVCDHIDISSSPRIDAVIQSKLWDNHLISTAFAGALPMSVPNKGGFTVVAVTSANPLTASVYISAQCKPASSPSVNTAITPISNEVAQFVTLSNDYYWTGSGSIISGLGSGTGKTSDFVPTFDTKKSFTTFQWQTTSSCSKLKLSSTSNINVAFNSITDNEVGLKEWNALDWQKQACIGLPCKISAPSVGKYYIVKVKTDAGAMTGTSGSSSNSGYLNAQCVQ